MIIRHDIDPTLYIADPTQFSAVMVVNSTKEEIPIAYDNIDRVLKPSLIAESKATPEFCDRTDGMGILIHPCWVLTVGHVALDLSVGDEIQVAGSAYAIEQIAIHPNFRNWGENLAFARHDIGLLKLARSVEGVKPMLLYQQHDELHKTVTLLGSGDFGHGFSGPDCIDGKLRKATNRIEALDEEWLALKFDEPPDSTDLEGVSGPGDSGGPALLPFADGWAIAGISSGQDSGKLGEGRYGVMDYYTRVSQYVEWIESVIKNGRTA